MECCALFAVAYRAWLASNFIERNMTGNQIGYRDAKNASEEAKRALEELRAWRLGLILED